MPVVELVRYIVQVGSEEARIKRAMVNMSCECRNI